MWNEKFTCISLPFVKAEKNFKARSEDLNFGEIYSFDIQWKPCKFVSFRPQTFKELSK